MRIEDIGKKISYLWMIFSGMSVERLRRYVGGGRREESERVRKVGDEIEGASG